MDSSLRRVGRRLAPFPFIAGLVLATFVLARASAALGPEFSVFELPNGARLLVSEQSNLPMVLVRVFVDGGSRWDPTGREGAANLTAELLTEGTKTRGAAEISSEIDFIGASLNASAALDYAQLSLQVLAKDLDTGLGLLADVLRRPVFDGEELARQKESVLASLRAARDDPTDVALRAFRRAVFGNGPYGHAVEGEEEPVARITRDDVLGFYRRHYHPGRSLIVVVGALSPAEARERLEAALGGWDGETAPEFVYPTPGPSEARRIRIDKTVSQASIVLGHRGIRRKDPDYETLSVMNYILGGGGFSSRLMESIRIRTGLAYSVNSRFSANQWSGTFSVVMQTKNASVEEAIRRARAEIERIRTESVSEEELNEAKRYLTGSFPLRLDSNTKILSFIGATAFYGLGRDYADRYVERVNAVTVEDVLRVAREHLHPEQLVEVVVGDLSRAGLAGD